MRMMLNVIEIADQSAADQHILQDDLLVLTDWCINWDMEFNSDKSCLLLLGNVILTALLIILEMITCL